MKRFQGDSLSRRAMKLLCKLLGLTFVAMLAFTLAFWQLTKPIQRIDPGPIRRETALSVFSPIQLGSNSSGGELEKIGGAGSGILNILLVGQDRREGEDTSRSDSMILCTFHKESKRLVMTSFLRDLYVQIPGHSANRINAAYATGGITLLDQTLEQNFGLHIDGNVEVDFSQFAGIIDLLGGVQIELRSDEAQVINRETGSSLTEGSQTLDGIQALTYSRIRSLDTDGDFSRTNRQRKVISALLDAYRDLPLNDLLPLISRLLPLISTDMSNAQLLLCAMDILPCLSQAQVVSQRIPAEGTYTDKTIDGMAVLSADMDAARQMLKQSLLGR